MNFTLKIIKTFDFFLFIYFFYCGMPFKMFTKNLDTEFYIEVLGEIPVLFMRNFNGGNCRFLQDNAPSHVTSQVFNFLREKQLRWVNFLATKSLLINIYAYQIHLRQNYHHIVQILMLLN